MLRLNLFGGVTLEREAVGMDWPGRGWQRAALLALLASARQRGIDRRLLAELLWPDSPEAAARHSLDELLSKVRRDISRDLLLGTSTVCLDEQQVSTDIVEFEDALASGRFDAAVECYRGPFADGLRTHDSDELEKRISAIRVRFANEFARCIERLARAAADRGDHAAAATWWRRLVDSDPLASRPTRELIAALDAAGERAEALRVAVRHEAAARAEYGGVDQGILDRIASPPGAGGDEDRQASAVRRALAGTHHGVRLIDNGSVEVIYEATPVDGSHAVVNVRLLQAPVSARVTPKAFADVFERARHLRHPHVLPVLSYVADRDVLLSVTPRKPETSLKQHLRKHRMLGINDALRLGANVAGALAAMHARDVFHGNLRPRHIGIGDGGMLSGYGLVQVFAKSASDEGRSTVFSQGSPVYQSPEQFLGHVGVDRACDAYALGTILYEMLAGRTPFGPQGDLDGMQRKLREAAPGVRTIRDAVTDEVERTIAACLERLPADRPLLAEVESALRRSLDASDRR